MRAAHLSDVLKGPPAAFAELKKSARAPHLQGKIQFYPWSNGVLMKSEFVNLPAQSYYQISFGGEKPLIRHMPKFYSGNGYALFLFFIDRIRIEDLMGQTLYLSGVNFISEERAEITSGAIQNKKSQI